ncbi:uncharacterized protein L201_004171 [Kwoniella dendrophila CBS 6074]|uniref:SUZ domain-containing protein n=1 Tax=Kwoniella dendrophila CBS 6074 TaxID=1295534 RepID=A0AAX4JUY2_9TREE
MQPPNISSPTLATPKPSSLNLKASNIAANGPFSLPESQQENGGESRLAENSQDIQDGRELLENDTDGRITPTADSRSNPSLASSSSSNVPSPNPTTISLLSQTTNSTSNNNPIFTASITHPAEIGFGNLQSEEQLKVALQSKDRMFLLVLSKEFEAFINKLTNGQIPHISNYTSQTPTISTSLMAALGSSMNIGVTPTSKFQRMLVYKTAEWYGLKAVPNQDGGMIIGVLGDFNEKSSSLKLSELVPAAPSSNSQTQKFRIMQRAPAQSASGSSSPAEGSSSGPKWKTLEEREAAYAAAREKIYGKSGESEDNVEIGLERVEVGEQPQVVDDEVDPVPRQLYQQYEVVYPSLYHPPKPEPDVPPPINDSPTNPNVPNQYQLQPNAYGYQSSYPPYPQQMDSNSYSMMSQGYPPNQSISSQQSYPTYMDGSQNGYMIPQQNGYPVPVGWPQGHIQQNSGYPGQIIPPNQQPYGIVPMQQQSSQGWQYHGQMMPVPPQPSQQPMPMIPQGVPYPTSYGYSPIQPTPQFPQHPQPLPPPPPIPPYRQGSYPPLAQPTPMRPAMQPHSSASSSISSRSYQDGSRPHSRGSTTSTRSAASSVRLGAMYPATQGPGFRQRAMKGQGLNGLTSLGVGGPGTDQRRNMRAHSPSSTTSASSRSSRRTSSIQLAPPSSSQHQLPQRPDWAANNVPYHPSPLPVPGTNGHNPTTMGGTNPAEFPPLLRQGQGTNAEPMQVERVKIKPSESVWNGNPVKNIQYQQQQYNNNKGNSSLNGDGVGQEQPKITIISGPNSSNGGGVGQQSCTPVSAISNSHHSQSHQNQNQISEIDPDFPRRLPTKTQPILYDPSMPSSSSSSSRHNSSIASNSRPSSVNTNKSIPNSGIMSAEDIIEAKLAQISINNGIPIGLAPISASSVSVSGSRNGNGNADNKSYAKVVRRD